MNKNILEGNWEMLRGKIESEWGKLRKDPSKEAMGDFSQLKGYLQKQYGWKEEEAKEAFLKLESLLKEVKIKDNTIGKIIENTSKGFKNLSK